MKKRRTAGSRRARFARASKTLKTAAVHARLTSAQLVKLHAMAHRAGLTPSAFVGRMIEVHEQIELEAMAAAKSERAALDALDLARRAA